MAKLKIDWPRGNTYKPGATHDLTITFEDGSKASIHDLRCTEKFCFRDPAQARTFREQIKFADFPILKLDKESRGVQMFDDATGDYFYPNEGVAQVELRKKRRR